MSEAELNALVGEDDTPFPDHIHPCNVSSSALGSVARSQTQNSAEGKATANPGGDLTDEDESSDEELGGETQINMAILDSTEITETGAEEDDNAPVAPASLDRSENHSGDVAPAPVVSGSSCGYTLGICETTATSEPVDNEDMALSPVVSSNIKIEEDRP